MIENRKVNIAPGPRRRRARQALVITLCSLGLLLARENALAGSWYAATINGQGGANGRVSDALLVSSSVLAGNTFFVYLTDIDTGTIYEGQYVNGDWHYAPVYSGGPAAGSRSSANVLGFYRVVAHADADQRLRLSVHSPFGSGWGTEIADGNNITRIGSRYDNTAADVATVVFKNKLYIFYEGFQVPGNGKYLLLCAVWDGSTFTYQALDGEGGAAQKMVANMSEPAVVVAPDGLRVYYHDDDHGTLREAYSPDGVNWTHFANLDGSGGLGGDHGNVGWHPSAIVYNSTVNVFYGDATHAALRLAHLSGGRWGFDSIDTWDWQTSNAPVIHNNAMQVYYVSNGQIHAAWGTAPGTFQWLPIDGEGAGNDLAIGSLSYAWGYSYMTALEFNHAPTMFYSMTDVYPQTMVRNSYWLP
jgi:hypothetical protein